MLGGFFFLCRCRRDLVVRSCSVMLTMNFRERESSKFCQTEKRCFILVLLYMKWILTTIALVFILSIPGLPLEWPVAVWRLSASCRKEDIRCGWAGLEWFEEHWGRETEKECRWQEWSQVSIVEWLPHALSVSSELKHCDLLDGRYGNRQRRGGGWNSGIMGWWKGRKWMVLSEEGV